MSVNSKFVNLNFGKSKDKIDELLKERANQKQNGKKRKRYNELSKRNIAKVLRNSVSY